MKNLFASASYSFNNFYNNLNTQGQMVFSVIIFLIVLLCVLLFVTYIVQDLKNKNNLRKLRKEQKAISKEKSDIISETSVNMISKEPVKEIVQIDSQNIVKEVEPLYINEKTEIEDIATAINSALEEENPINLTNFEEEQEKTAIISIDELVKKAKELEIVDDDNGDINYLEKYNLEPAEAEEVVTNTVSSETNEVKAFKVSQIISPIYGVKKEALNNKDM